MIDNLPPHDLLAEQGALGCCMLDPQAMDAAQEFGLLDLWFYDLRHQTIWNVLCAMQRQGKPTHDYVVKCRDRTIEITADDRRASTKAKEASLESENQGEFIVIMRGNRVVEAWFEGERRKP